VLLLERIERRVLSDRQIIMQAVAAGVDVDLPDVQDAWDEFDAALVESRAVDPDDRDRADLLRALGIGR
jgi:hypothetical protein